MKRVHIICGLLFCFAAGLGAYLALHREKPSPVEEPQARLEQTAREAAYVKERDERYRTLLERGTKELYEDHDAEAARRTFNEAIDISLDDVQRYQAWRWLAEVVRDTDAGLLRRAGQQMHAIGRTERERAEGLMITAEAQEKLGGAREAVKAYEAAAVEYQKAGDSAAGCIAFQHAADAALLPGLQDLKLCRRMLEAEEKLLTKVNEGAERERIVYDFMLSQADLLRREGKKEESRIKFSELEGFFN